jgi:hypothetical protein
MRLKSSEHIEDQETANTRTQAYTQRSLRRCMGTGSAAGDDDQIRQMELLLSFNNVIQENFHGQLHLQRRVKQRRREQLYLHKS